MTAACHAGRAGDRPPARCRMERLRRRRARRRATPRGCRWNDKGNAPSWSASHGTMSPGPHMAPRPGHAARRAPIVAARSASSNTHPEVGHGREITSAIEVTPFGPGCGPRPSATVTPWSSSRRTRGRRACRAEPGARQRPRLPGQRGDVLLTGLVGHLGGRAAIGGQQGRAVRRSRRLPARAGPNGGHAERGAPHPRRTRTSRRTRPRCPRRPRSIRAPGARRVDVISAAPEGLQRDHVRGQDACAPAASRARPGAPQHADVGQLAVPGQVIAGLRLDGGRPGPASGHPLPHPVAPVHGSCRG